MRTQLVDHLLADLLQDVTYLRTKKVTTNLSAISFTRLRLTLRARTLSTPRKCTSSCFSERTFSEYLAPHVGGAGVFVGRAVGSTTIGGATPAADTPTLTADVNTREEL
jgi:hypothetical protein